MLTAEAAPALAGPRDDFKGQHRERRRCRLRCSGGGASGVGRVVEGFVTEHGAGHGEEAIADGAECASVGVAFGAEGAVARFADGVPHAGDAGPVVDGFAKFVLDGEASGFPTGLPGLDADGGDPGAEAEGGVVAALEEVVGLGEEGAGDEEADSGDGEEDGEVIGPVVVGFGEGERLQQFPEVALCLGEELLGGSGLGEQRGERPDGGRGGSGGDGECGGLEDVAQGGCAQSPDPVLLQEVTEDRRVSSAACWGVLVLSHRATNQGSTSWPRRPGICRSWGK